MRDGRSVALAARHVEQVEEPARGDDGDAAEAVHRQQPLVAGDEVVGLTGDGGGENEVVLWDETERNLMATVPQALPTLAAVRSTNGVRSAEPSDILVREAATVVVAKDAPIVAGAVEARADDLATNDRKHLLAQAGANSARYGGAVATPDTIIAARRGGTG